MATDRHFGAQFSKQKRMDGVSTGVLHECYNKPQKILFSSLLPFLPEGRRDEKTSKAPSITDVIRCIFNFDKPVN